MDDDVATEAGLKALNLSLQSEIAALQFAQNLILQAMVDTIERQVGPEFRATLARNLKSSWEISHRAVGDDHPIVSSTQEIIQEFINSLEGH